VNVSEARTCPSCGAPAPGESNFCEECGTALSAEVAGPAGTVPPVAAGAGESSPIEDLGSGPISSATTNYSAAARQESEVRACASCGGTVGPDQYCEQCGVKALSPRDHFREQPASWVAGVCDKGIRHHRNEDAMAILASDDGLAADRRAVLVVLDGVSNTDDSQIGSLAGANAALAVLAAPFPDGLGTTESRVAAVTHVLTGAVKAAQAEVVAAATADADNPASATFSAAVLEGDVVSYANVGDSRSYWLPDTSPGVQLSIDDSAAQALIAEGMPRAQAESSPQAHGITKWLGRDSEDHTPMVGQLTITEPGWLMVCSDGLWNYASEPEQLKEQVQAAGTEDPAALALALTDFANRSGGQDNITAVLARVPGPANAHNAAQTPTTKEQLHG
jgi:serine/threonine protein phosphatase PrpC/RNA polymerase subunit RPABC4/transcription elongation factor Spt4